MEETCLRHSRLIRKKNAEKKGYGSGKAGQASALSVCGVPPRTFWKQRQGECLGGQTKKNNQKRLGLL